jgi:phosphatidate cytidylyltransferase
MADADPARSQAAASSGGGLAVRMASALVLAPLAVAFAYVGGWAFELFWGLAALIVIWEWSGLAAGIDRRSVFMVGAASILIALALAGSIVNVGETLRELRLLAAVLVLALGMLVTCAFVRDAGRGWAASGIPYAAAIGLAPIVLRVDGGYGFLAMIYLFAIVWSTDIMAYFAGRVIGGPKLAPHVSPGKTWAGALGGLVGGAVAAVAVAMAAGLGGLVVVTSIAIVLSVCAQAGDLFESALKRRFGVKDSSRLIPGHGGLMDRLDGFVAAASLACVIGLVRGGVEAPARGLLVW